MSVLDFLPSKDFTADWDAWHKKHEDRLAAPDGFLAITSINWLTETPARFPDAPGEWSADDSGVTVTLAPGEDLTLDGTPITGRHHFGQIPERGEVFPSDTAGVYEVAKRGGNDILRPRHPGTPLRTGLHGTPGYAPDPRWVLRGRYRPFTEPRDVTTYAANRSLQVPAPDSGGTVVLDFNRATNLPCAYTEFATCPLPPAENRLPIAVEAGELIPHEVNKA